MRVRARWVWGAGLATHCIALHLGFGRTSMLSALILPTISRTRCHWPLPTCVGPRHAAPMQKRVLPDALARRAACGGQAGSGGRQLEQAPWHGQAIRLPEAPGPVHQRPLKHVPCLALAHARAHAGQAGRHWRAWARLAPHAHAHAASSHPTRPPPSLLPPAQTHLVDLLQLEELLCLHARGLAPVA